LKLHVLGMRSFLSRNLSRRNEVWQIIKKKKAPF
jgi:hypothetical protein